MLIELYMHELSIAESIIDIVKTETAHLKTPKIYGIIIEIGALSGVEIDALEFAFEAIKKESILKDAVITINKIDAKVKCIECDHVFFPDNLHTACPVCGSFIHKVITGQEMKVRSITAEER